MGKDRTPNMSDRGERHITPIRTHSQVADAYNERHPHEKPIKRGHVQYAEYTAIRKIRAALEGMVIQ